MACPASLPTGRARRFSAAGDRTDFVPAEQDGEPQPVLLVDHLGGPVGPAVPTRLFENGKVGIAVVNAAWSPRGTARHAMS